VWKTYFALVLSLRTKAEGELVATVPEKLR
jgi:hypothetical protein